MCCLVIELLEDEEVQTHIYIYSQQHRLTMSRTLISAGQGSFVLRSGVIAWLTSQGVTPSPNRQPTGRRSRPRSSPPTHLHAFLVEYTTCHFCSIDSYSQFNPLVPINSQLSCPAYTCFSPASIVSRPYCRGPMRDNREASFIILGDNPHQPSLRLVTTLLSGDGNKPVGDSEAQRPESRLWYIQSTFLAWDAPILSGDNAR